MENNGKVKTKQCKTMQTKIILYSTSVLNQIYDIGLNKHQNGLLQINDCYSKW